MGGVEYDCNLVVKRTVRVGAFLWADPCLLKEMLDAMHRRGLTVAEPSETIRVPLNYW